MKFTSSLNQLSKSHDPAESKRRVPAWLIPVGIAAGFGSLFLALFGDRLLPAPDVDVAAVLVAPSGEQPAVRPKEGSVAKSNQSEPEGAPLFQASGWLEPSPLPIKATSLVDGVIATVEVLQGQDVKKGDLLATLIDDDARLAVATARQRHQTLISTLTAHEVAIAAARKRVAGLEAQAQAAATLRDEAGDRLRRLSQLSADAIAESDLVTARLRLHREESQYLVATSAAEETEAEIERLGAESQVRRDDIAAAVLEVEKAQLALDRTRILAPADGRVLRLLAAPGQKKMLEDQDPESSTIAVLYQPGKLQVRVDVPLADAAGLQVGQPVKIRCSLLPDRVFRGEVTLISGEADVQRNTLQAKVSLRDPIDQFRPEMLCRVEFLQATNPSPTAPAVSTGSLAAWVPESAATGGALWTCDPESKRVKKKEVQSTSENRDGYVRIEGDLNPGEWVVLSPADLRDGQRVNPNLVEK